MANDPTPPTPSAPSPLSLHSTSSIASVVMHGRGALVTRRVVPEDVRVSAGAHVTVAVAAITGRALPQGVRVKLEEGSTQRLHAVRHERVLGEHAQRPAATAQSIQECERALRHARNHKKLLGARHKAITGLTLMPARHRTWREKGPLQRIETSLQLSDLIHERQKRYDAEMLDLTEHIAQLERDLAKAQLATHQESSTTHQTQAATTTLHVTLVCPEGGPIEPFWVSYLVSDARWWPLYTLRLTQGGTHANLSMEAMVTQHTGEDWDEVHIALSTADLQVDANLPTLAALKLGKRKPARRSGYREAPEGRERLFASHDAFMSRQAAPATPRPEPVSTFQDSSKVMTEGTFGGLEPYEDDDLYLDELAESSEVGGGAMPAPQAPPMPPMGSRPPMAKRGKGGFGAAGVTRKAANLASSAFARESMAEPTRKQRALIGDLALEERSISQGYDDEDDEAAGVEPQGSWLDFAHLVLGDGSSAGTRGVLYPAPATSISDGDLRRAELAAVETELIDPRVSRGHYDHRYESAASIVSVPSDGVLHRIDMLRRSTDARLSWRCVPIEEEQVFRLAAITNPFEAPMLTGPIDVFVEGSFLLSTRQHHVDVGARLEIGLGVDERIRVARNVRTEEESHGLLGGKTSITHTITTELASNLGFEAQVQVIDRVPITYDDDIHIKELDHDPPARAYTQRELHHDVKGGRHWHIKLPPGQKQVITSQYTITLSSKEEIVGGNRRD